MIRKRGGWLSVLFLGEMLTATAMGHFEDEIARAVVLALFVPLIISSGGNSGSQAATLIIRALALEELRLRDWWRVFRRELRSGLDPGRAAGRHRLRAHRALAAAAAWHDYGPHYLLVGLTVWLSLIGVVMLRHPGGQHAAVPPAPARASTPPPARRRSWPRWWT